MSGYQLKVGGVVVGSWAGSVPNRANSNSLQARLNRAAIAAAQESALGQQVMRYPFSARNRVQINARLARTTNGTHSQTSSLSKTISRNTYGNNKVNRNRNRNRNRKNGESPRAIYEYFAVKIDWNDIIDSLWQFIDRKASKSNSDGTANDLAPIAEHDQAAESESSST